MQTRYDHGGIELRPLDDTDAKAFRDAVLASVDTVGRVFSWCHRDYSEAEAQAWISRCKQAWQTQGDYPFAIFDTATGDLLGSIGINHLNTVHRSGNIGYWVRAGQTRRGICKAAVALVARFGFAELGLVRLEIVTQLDNLASQRVAESAGARFECIARHRIVMDGQAQDARVYALIPADLPDLAGTVLSQHGNTV